jgi:two-component system, OmpR family, phosphate regulon sensor histidine kinase PhoR
VADDRRSAIEQFFQRYPHAVLGVDSGLRIAFTNERARALLGDEASRVGARLDPSFRLVAERLTRSADGVSSEVVTDAGLALRITGVPANGAEPAVLVVEEVSGADSHARVLQEFIRNAAHQLRTPLTAITAAVEVLQAGAKERPAERDHFLAHVERHTARLTRIARGLLALARAQSGIGVTLQPVVLKPLLEGLADEALPQSGVGLHVECPPGLAALAEPDLLFEALTALLDNAVEHTAVGRITLTAAAAGGTVELTVTDTGGGIAPEHRPRIFEAFYSSARGGHRFGLGLAITSQAVEVMGGTLRSVDAEGGATFVIELRAA